MTHREGVVGATERWQNNTALAPIHLNTYTTPAPSLHLTQNPPLSQFISTLKPLRELLKNGRKFTFRVTILQATGIPRDFTDIFLQFRFLNGGDEAFSTVSLKNENQDLALGFYHMQNVSDVETDGLNLRLRTSYIVFMLCYSVALFYVCNLGQCSHYVHTKLWHCIIVLASQCTDRSYIS